MDIGNRRRLLPGLGADVEGSEDFSGSALNELKGSGKGNGIAVV